MAQLDTNFFSVDGTKAAAAANEQAQGGQMTDAQRAAKGATVAAALASLGEDALRKIIAGYEAASDSDRALAECLASHGEFEAMMSCVDAMARNIERARLLEMVIEREIHNKKEHDIS